MGVRKGDLVAELDPPRPGTSYLSSPVYARKHRFGSDDEGNNTAGVTVILDLDDLNADSSGAVQEKPRRRFSAFPGG
jgi:hypothetical protein